MKKWGLALLLWSSPALAVPPVVTPSTPIATVKGTIQFSCPDLGSWTVTAGSLGSIGKGNGLYTAPTTFFSAKNVSAFGCQLEPNDSVANTRIDALPVDANSAARIANVTTVLTQTARVTFDDNMPTNLYSSSTPLVNMNFRSTSGANGNFPLIDPFHRGQEGSSFANIRLPTFQDQHILGVDSGTCRASEMYQYFPIGLDPGAPSANSNAGDQYYTNWYRLPDVTSGAGGVDAAGMHVQPLLVRYNELKAGLIQHALRMTLDNGNLYGNGTCPAAALWPATDCTAQCSNIATCFPYGSRIRLKATYGCGRLSAGGQALCLALQRYGAFFVDGGTAFQLTANYDAGEDTTTWSALYDDFQLGVTSMSSTDFEQVDESSLMVSSFTSQVNLSNAFVVPDNFAEVTFTRTSDAVSTTVRIGLQPVTVGWSNPAFYGGELDAGINVMAGTPQFQIPFWVNGASDTTASCSLSPALGTLTSGCLYTAPASVNFTGISSATVTITPTMDPARAVSFPIVVVSSDGYRMRSGPREGSVPPFTAIGDYQDATGHTWLMDPVGNIPGNFYTRRILTPEVTWPSIGTMPLVPLMYQQNYGSGDKVFAGMAPAGSYTLSLYFGVGNNPEDVIASTNSLDTQSVIFKSSVSLVSATYTPNVVTQAVTVGSDHTFYFAVRGNQQNSHSFVNAWSLLFAAAPSAPVITSGLTATGTVGLSFNYQITATNSPTSYSVNVLPPGLSLNTATGVISGVPTTTGVTNSTISATNAGGTGNATLVITINPFFPINVQGNVQTGGNVGFTYR